MTKGRFNDWQQKKQFFPKIPIAKETVTFGMVFWSSLGQFDFSLYFLKYELSQEFFSDQLFIVKSQQSFVGVRLQDRD